MPHSDPSPIQKTFAEAAALPIDQRKAFLDHACAGDPVLRAEVEELLQAQIEAGEFLKSPAAELPAQARIDLTGTRIGRYKILEILGEGGFAVVYRAEQMEPVRREVALKIIKLGMDTRQVIARFEAERQALAILDHPNIAKVFDAGATDTGRLYFVMELVRGQPVTDYCDRRGFSARQRLELFVPICQAVQHAHHKGIIHRDIKPSNVLILEQQGEPVPKVIDFGVAKATQARLTQRTLFTELRQMIGTPAYMSPEQARLDPTDIDTRSDIYSLGVLLYELLTGTTPIDEKDLRAAAYEQMQKMIREVDPPSPSTRVTLLGESASSVAAVRHVEPKELSRSIRGEVDWIVMKCLEKDRSRRYESAGALSEDIARHLTGGIVSASPPSIAYRTRKFVAHHRWGLAVACVLVLSLLGGLIVSLIALSRVNRERLLALRANEAAIAAVRASIGRSPGRAADSTPFRESYLRLKAAYGPDHRLTIVAGNDLAFVLIKERKFDEAFALLDDALARARNVFGPHSPELIGTVNYMTQCLDDQDKWEQALPFAMTMFEIVNSDDVSPELADYYCDWGANQLMVLQHYAEARQPLINALELLERRVPTAHMHKQAIMANLSRAMDALNQPEEAASWRRRAADEANLMGAAARGGNFYSSPTTTFVR